MRKSFSDDTLSEGVSEKEMLALIDAGLKEIKSSLLSLKRWVIILLVVVVCGFVVSTSDLFIMILLK